VRGDRHVTSHWTLHGAPLPYVPVDGDWEPETEVPAYVGLYEASRRRFTDRLVDAAIAVEKIRHLVLVAGGEPAGTGWHADAARKMGRERPIKRPAGREERAAGARRGAAVGDLLSRRRAHDILDR
jgi:hypothetical protein